MSAAEKRKAIKSLLRGYTHMSRKIVTGLNELGYTVEVAGKHLKIYGNNHLYVTSITGSDHRAGMNLASVMCRDI